MSEEKTKTHGGKVGAVTGAIAGALTTVMANPIGRWSVFTAQDEVGRAINRGILDLTKNADLSFGVHRFYDLVTNTIMAYPAILPIAGGALAAGVGALIGHKVSKSKLKHQSLKQKEKEHTL